MTAPISPVEIRLDVGTGGDDRVLEFAARLRGEQACRSATRRRPLLGGVLRDVLGELRDGLAGGPCTFLNGSMMPSALTARTGLMLRSEAARPWALPARPPFTR